MMMKGMGKQTTGLRNFSNEKKVWIGGLPANQVSKEVNMKMKDHMSTAPWNWNGYVFVTIYM